MVTNADYKKITNVLVEAFRDFKFIKNDSINSILNKLTFIEKSQFKKFGDDEENEYNMLEYDNALKNQKKQIEMLIKLININPTDTLKTIFQHDQTLFFRIRVNGLTKNIFHRKMTVEYLLEDKVIKEKKYKTILINMFDTIIKKYETMETSLMGIKDGKFVNQTDIEEVDDTPSIFIEKIKSTRRLKQDLLLAFILYRNKVIKSDVLNKFIDTYLQGFKKVVTITPNSVLEKENIYVWASGVRFIEVLADNFKYSNKYTKEFTKQKPIVDFWCPTLRFM